jgi:hypothetical protein
MGMRVGPGVGVDESLPFVNWEAPSIEVAADFTGIYNILVGRDRSQGESLVF